MMVLVWVLVRVMVVMVVLVMVIVMGIAMLSSGVIQCFAGIIRRAKTREAGR